MGCGMLCALRRGSKTPVCNSCSVKHRGFLLPEPAGAQGRAWACVAIISSVTCVEFGPGNEFLSVSFTSEPCSWAGCWLCRLQGA